MRAWIIQHVPYEGPGTIGEILREKRCPVSYTRVYNNDPFPSPDQYDLLIIMGGPMGVDESGSFPWLKDEFHCIERALHQRKGILGICLGAQIIAHVLGAPVYKNQVQEIGWFPVTLTEEGKSTPLFTDFPQEPTVFHWHGDTFDIPNGAIHLLRSKECEHQAFVYNSHVLGLQFHLEMAGENVHTLIENCGRNFISSDTVQSSAEMIQQCSIHEVENNRLMKQIIENLLYDLG